MWTKILGSICIIGVCGGYACHLAMLRRLDEYNLRQLIFLLNYMESELHFRLTPLPELCRIGAEYTQGILSDVFSLLYDTLTTQQFSSVDDCMAEVINGRKNIPTHTKEILVLLGTQLGHFGLEGQVRSLDSVIDQCTQLLCKLNDENSVQVRHYKTIGLCAAAALVIIFI